METHIAENLIAVGIQIGRVEMGILAGLVVPDMSKSRAIEIYGPERIDRWLGAGKIKYKRQGEGRNSKINLDTMDLEKARLSECQLLKSI